MSNTTGGTAADFAVPAIMNWTILPISLVARCWADEAFREEFTANPDAFIAAMPWRTEVPVGASFAVHHNTRAEVRHLPLPHFHESLREMSPQEVRSLLQTETGNDTSLEWFLPADVIAEAFYSADYREKLLAHPAEALAAMGYDTDGLEVIVHANTADRHNLTVPCRPAELGQAPSHAAAMHAATAMMN